MVKWTLVGSRDGKAVVNWPGVLKAVCVIGFVMLIGTIVMARLLGRSMFEPIPLFWIVFFLAFTIGVGVHRALRLPPESLPPLGSHAA